MIECYYDTCPHHPQDEPFCPGPCDRTPEQLAKLREKRIEWLKEHGSSYFHEVLT